MSETNKWFPYGIKQNTKSKHQLFCFYCAGASSSVFKKWVNTSNEIEFIPVELPGRGIRIGESRVEKIETIVNQIIPSILETIHGEFSFFGHSMGAAIAFQLAWQLQSNHKPMPGKIIVAGRHAPHQPDPSELNSKMNDIELVNELKKLNGTPIEILDNPEMVRFLIPMIKSDLRLHESFKYTGQKLNIPIIAHCGNMDFEANLEIMKYWEQVTNDYFQIKEFEGDHFFVNALEENYKNELITTLTQKQNEKKISYT